MRIRFTIPAVLFVALVLSACNTAQSDWRNATAANTVAAY